MTVSAETRRVPELVLRRIFAIVLIVLGVATVGVGVGLATVWRPSETVTATLPNTPEVPVVIAGGNVLATVNDDVTVTVKGADAQTPIVLAMGHESDVKAWLDGSAYEQITGLEDWSTLAVTSSGAGEDASAEPDGDSGKADTDKSDSNKADTDEGKSNSSDEADKKSAGAGDPAGSDLWIEQVSGQGELSYDWSRVDGRWMMLVASNGSDPAPTVSLSWQRQVTTPFVVPAYIVGAVLFLIGAVWLIFELLVAHERRKAQAAAAEASAAAPSVATTDAEGKPLTRRQIREAERAAERKRRGEPPLSVPAAPTPGDESRQDEGAKAAPNSTSDDEETSVLPVIGGETKSNSSADETVRTADDSGEDHRQTDGASDLAEWVRQTTGAKTGSGTGAPAQNEAGAGTLEEGSIEDDPQPQGDSSPAAEDLQASAARALGASWRQTWGIATSATSSGSDDADASSGSGDADGPSSPSSPTTGDDEENEGKTKQ